MRRVSLDRMTKDVQQFICDLPINGDGVELELNGKIVCEVLPPHSLCETERAALIGRGREVARRAQSRNQGVPAAVIEQEVRDAVEEVRRRHSR